MATKTYLDLAGLTYYDSKIKEYITNALPTVSNATITISGATGQTDQTFTLNGSAKTINITKAFVGLGSVANTGDSDTPTSGGTTKFTTGGAYTLKQDLLAEIRTQSAHFRGSFATWSAVPTDASGYLEDSEGSHIPTYNDYMIVEDASGYSVTPTLSGAWRFIYVGVWSTDGKNGWAPAYAIDTPITGVLSSISALTSGTGLIKLVDGIASLQNAIASASVSGNTLTLTPITGSAITFTASSDNYYHTPSYSAGLNIATGSGVNDLYVPYATGSQAGAVMVGTGLGISSGTISLGSHASTATTYGVGTSTNYGHVKLGASDQNGATAADGVAAPNGHTHSQYLTSHQTMYYRPVSVNGTSILANTSSDAINLKNGTNVSITGTVGSSDITISSTDTNYYHSPTYSAGLKIAIGTGVSDLYVPSASSSRDGVVTTGTQTFSGNKIFENDIYLRGTGTITFGGSSMGKSYHVYLYSDGSNTQNQTLTLPDETDTLATQTYVANYTGAITNTQIDTLFA